MLQVTRPQIYQLMVRHFGNTNLTRKRNGSIEENGCGKFNDINDAELLSLKKLGITHIWLTGVLEQASATSYPDRPADTPILLKGKAGSPYAIKDYFDVCPDYALESENRLDEFKDLLQRIKSHGLKALIDFVPNHVSRAYESSVHPELSFGKNDDTTKFFDPNNNFFYLNGIHPGEGAPLKLPTKKGSVVYKPESEFGRVTGNNAITWAPSINDWYETIKLNYGHDFTLGVPRDDIRKLPASDAPLIVTPDTWQKMDTILAYWQDMGIDGFRVDMAHMIPMAYWTWQLKRCRERHEKCLFIAEAYDGDPAKLTEGNVLEALLESGFDAVYDSPTYETLKKVIAGDQWANDIDEAADPFSDLFHKVVRYAENHDEVRIGSKGNWAKGNTKIGRPVSAILYGLGRGPLMIYNGQEVGEEAKGAEGFSGNDGRNSIFDYGALPSLAAWTNSHLYDGEKLSHEKRLLRDFYSNLLNTCKEPAFTKGEFYGLNHANHDKWHFGRLHGEDASGHWIYSFLRRDEESGQAFLIVANLHAKKSFDGVTVLLPEHAIDWLGLSDKPNSVLKLKDRLGSLEEYYIKPQQLMEHGLLLPAMEAASAYYLEIT